MATVGWLGIAGPIWQATKSASPDAWIGFAGNALGAGMTLLAATAAAIAAYWTIIPMRRQLSELVRQNNFAHYERLRQRAAELMDMKVLIENVTANLEVMHRSLARLIRERAPERLASVV
ncbi:putative oligopeptide transporter (OPT) family protein [Bradyrhizobium barranii subsp. barranii]